MSSNATPQNQSFSSHIETTQDGPLDEAGRRAAWMTFSALVVGLVVCYWNMLVYTSSFWGQALYSHGWIVPLFAGYLLVRRSGVQPTLSSKEVTIGSALALGFVGLHTFGLLSELKIPSWVVLVEVSLLVGMLLYYIRSAPMKQVESGERWIGLGILTVSLVIRLVASYYSMEPLNRLSFVAALIGVCQLTGGFSMLRWAGAAMGFLVFMYPLPSVLERNVLLELQKGAAICSTWTLQILGVPAIREGSRIVIDQLPLEVADACSGLRMSTIFGAMAVAMILLIDRPWWDRLVILLSSIPIALLTNVIRIVVTALLYKTFPDGEMLHKIVHDWAGLAMMPLALGFLWLELQLLTRLTVPMETDDYAGFGAPANA